MFSLDNMNGKSVSQSKTFIEMDPDEARQKKFELVAESVKDDIRSAIKDVLIPF